MPRRYTLTAQTMAYFLKIAMEVAENLTDAGETAFFGSVNH